MAAIRGHRQRQRCRPFRLASFGSPQPSLAGREKRQWPDRDVPSVRCSSRPPALLTPRPASTATSAALNCCDSDVVLWSRLKLLAATLVARLCTATRVREPPPGSASISELCHRMLASPDRSRSVPRAVGQLVRLLYLLLLLDISVVVLSSWRSIQAKSHSHDAWYADPMCDPRYRCNLPSSTSYSG